MPTSGTNYFDGYSPVDHALADGNGNWVLVRSTVANIPSAAAGYAIGCLLQATDTGNAYVNTGTASSSTFTMLESSTSGFTLPLAETDATTTTGTSLAIADTTLTSGSGIKVTGTTAVFTTGGSLFKADLSAATAGNGFTAVTTGAYTGTGLLVLTANGLTTGVLANLTHTTSVIADGGSLLRIASSSVDTGGATNGTLLDVKSTGQLAGTVVRFDNILTTGTGISVIGTGVMTTTGNLLTLTANSATTAAGLLRINANGLTDGIGAIIASSATAMTSTGRLLKVDHTGATGVSTIIGEVASAATDETTVFQVTASAALALGKVLNLSAAAVTTGTVLSAANADALTTGTIANLTSNSADTTARKLVQIVNDNTAAVGAVPLYLQQDAVGTTHFKTLMLLGTIGIYVSDETTPNAALSAAKGSICLNGSATGQAFWNTDGSTAWTALA